MAVLISFDKSYPEYQVTNKQTNKRTNKHTRQLKFPENVTISIHGLNQPFQIYTKVLILQLNNFHLEGTHGHAYIYQIYQTRMYAMYANTCVIVFLFKNMPPGYARAPFVYLIFSFEFSTVSIRGP